MGGSPAKQQVTELAELSALLTEKLGEGGSVAFSPRGISMLPMLRAYGDKVTLVKPPARMKKGMVALFISEAEGGGRRFILHRLVKIKGDELIFCGDRRLECDPPAKRSDVLGVVTEYVSRGHRHSVTEPLYRFYSFWMVHTVGVRSLAQKAQDAAYRVWKAMTDGSSRQQKRQ